MTTLVLEKEPVAVNVSIMDEKLTVDLDDGRSIMVPLEWYPRLIDASAQERNNWQLLGDGYAIEWLEVDEHIGIEGRRAGGVVVKAKNRLNVGWRLVIAKPVPEA